MKKHQHKPESLMMSYGYKPSTASGAVKMPLYQTSTFAFNTAEDGKEFFEIALGKKEIPEGKEAGMIYSRLNNPDLDVLEKRLCLWDKAEACAVFESGMAAISTALLEFLAPGDLLLFSKPVYGGSHHFIEDILPKYGINVLGFDTEMAEDELLDKLFDSGLSRKLKMVFIETPANPTMGMVDIQNFVKLAAAFSTEDKKVVVAVDNTFLGPLWQHPLQLGADLVLYSATKYIGGHSDVVAGACLGAKDLIQRIKGLRTYLGNMAAPHTSWLLMRSLETMKVRMEKQAKNARKVATFLTAHPMVEMVYYLDHFKDKRQQEIFNKQCESAGAMIAFDIAGGEKEAFAFLNALKLIKLAVSLGSTESLAEHPATMTHAGVPDEEKEHLNITSKLIRLSIGVENYKDIIFDLKQALEQIEPSTIKGSGNKIKS